MTSDRTVNCPTCGTKLRWRGIGGHIRYCPIPTEQLFWLKVNKSGGQDACWPWLGGKRHAGYGHFRPNGYSENAHRYSFQLAYGAIPKGMHVLHSCDVPACVNPAHLKLGTHMDNMIDKRNKGRVQAKLTHDDVRAIRKLIGKTMGKDIASMFGVGPGVISDIKTGRHWSYVK